MPSSQHSLKETSTLSSLPEGEDEQGILLHDGCRHTQCACIPSSVNATAPRKTIKSRATSSILRTDVPRSQHTRQTRVNEIAHPPTTYADSATRILPFTSWRAGFCRHLESRAEDDARAGACTGDLGSRDCRSHTFHLRCYQHARVRISVLSSNTC